MAADVTHTVFGKTFYKILVLKLFCEVLLIRPPLGPIVSGLNSDWSK